jgi:mannose-6-phosphate isomerase-like protein (cupin superfamily)
MKICLTRGLLAAAIATTSFAAFANHSWNNYHWARNTSSFNLQVIDSTTPDWDDELAQTVSDWSNSSVLNLQITAFDDSRRARKRCAMVSGKVRVCNASYGGTGWAGLASINLDSSGHITQGTAKMNDFYSMSADFRNHVMCQEVGHTFGLGHTSEDGSTQNTCMDYSNSPTSTRPNQHDYEQLVSMYGHLDSYNSYSTSAAMPTTKSPAGDMGWRIRKGVFDETWVSPDGDGGLWVHHVYLAPGHEHTELLDGE